MLTLGIPRGEPGTGGGGGGAVDSVNGKTGAVVLDAEDVGARPDTWAPDLTGLVEDDDPRLTDARTPLAHNHPVGDVTGLQDALDAKQAAGNYAAATHDHDARYVRTVNGNGPDGDGNVVVATDVGSVTWGSIEEKPSEFPPASHSHALGDVTGLTGALSGKVDGTDSRLSDARTPTAHDHPIADVTGLQNALDGKQAAGNYAAAVHDHDGRYYTQTQVDTALTGKVGTSDPRLTDAREPTAHSHAISDVTGLSDALDGKQAAGSYAAATHEHDADDLAGVVKTINGTPPDEDGNATISTGTAVAVLPPGRLPRPDITWIDTAQPGHGWTRPEPYGSLTDDTSVKVMGTQSIRVFSTAARISLPAIDMRHRDFVVLMRMGEMTGDTWVFLQISDSPSMSPLQGRLIGMGGSSWWREGEWLLVTVPGTATGTQLDMSAIRSAQIATYSDGEVWVQAIGTVPKTKSVITISFDDGYSSVIEAARQSMSPRGMVGTSYIIPDLIDSGANFMTLDDLHELKDMHGWDIQSHALPLAIDRDPEELRDELRDIRQWITDNDLGTGEHFAWAGGQFDPSAISVAKEVFTSARSIHDKMETMPPGEPHRLRGWTGIGGSLTVAQVSGIIDWCAAEGGWLHLVFHRITDSPIAPENCTWADFNAILDLITASGIPVRTVSDVLSGPPPPTVIPQAEYEELDPPPYVEYNVVMES